MADAMNDLEGEGKIVQLLVTTRLDMESEFEAGRRKRSVLWDCVLQKMKEINPNFKHSKDQITRKFLNLKTTYKRIKQRNIENGKNSSRWTFFYEFEAVYGARDFIDPPGGSWDEVLNESILQASHDSQALEDGSPVPKKKRGDNEILQFVKEENETLNEYISQASDDSQALEDGSAMNEYLEGEGKVVQLLVRTRLDMENEFEAGRKKKSVLWDCVLQKVKEIYPNLELSKEQIMRKFLNLRSTYKKIKRRYIENRRRATTWTFFNEFDEVYDGTRHSIDPPEFNLVCSLDDPLNEGNSQASDDSQVLEDGPPVPKKKRDNNEILQFLKEESRMEQKRHEEMIALEEKKLIMEEKRVNAMIELKDILKNANQR